MVVRYPDPCDPPALPSTKQLIHAFNRNAQPKVSITSTPNRDVLVIRVGETVLRDLKQLRKVEVHLGSTDLGTRRPPPPRTLDTAPLRDALMCNIYKEMRRAKLAKTAEEVKRKAPDETQDEYRDTKRLKPETCPTSIEVPKPSKIPKDDKSDEYPKAKPVPYFAFILSTILLGFLYIQVHDPITTDPVKILDPMEDLGKREDPDPQMWRPVKIAQDILRIFPKDSHFLQDPHTFWRGNIDDPRVRYLLRWISQTMWRRRRRRESRLEVERASETIWSDLEEPTQALAVVDRNRWIDFRYPVEVTTIAWNVFLDFVFYWLAD